MLDALTTLPLDVNWATLMGSTGGVLSEQTQPSGDAEFLGMPEQIFASPTVADESGLGRVGADAYIYAQQLSCLSSDHTPDSQRNTRVPPAPAFQDLREAERRNDASEGGAGESPALGIFDFGDSSFERGGLPL